MAVGQRGGHLEDHRAVLTLATDDLGNQVNRLETDRHGLHDPAAATFADHALAGPALRADHGRSFELDPELDRAPLVTDTHAPVVPSYAEGFPQQTLIHVPTLTS